MFDYSATKHLGVLNDEVSVKDGFDVWEWEIDLSEELGCVDLDYY